MAKAKNTQTPSSPTSEHDHDQDHSHAGHSHANQVRHPELTESKQISFTISWSEVEKTRDQVLRAYQPQVKTDGFRKGKAPLKLVMQVVGTEKVYQAVAEHLIPSAYAAAVKSASLQPVADPEIHAEKMEDNSDWVFHAHVAEKPKIQLGNYKKTLETAKKQFAAEWEKQEKERTAKEKDAQKVAKQKQTPAIAEPTPEQLADRKQSAQLDAMLAAVRDSLKPKIDELLVRQEMNRQLRELEDSLRKYQINLKSYLTSLGKTEEDIQQEYAARALVSLQIEFILDAIGESENIEVAHSELETKIQELFPQEKLEPRQQDYLRMTLRKQKILDFLKQM